MNGWMNEMKERNNEWMDERRMEGNVLTTHTTYLIYGFMASDIW